MLKRISEKKTNMFHNKTKKSRRHRCVFRAYKPDGWTVPVMPAPTKFRYEDARHELAKKSSN